MRIALIRPPEVNRIWVGIPEFFHDGIFLFPPMGLLYLKSSIESSSKHEVVVYDSLVHKSGYQQIEDFIREYSPDVVGILAFLHSLVDVVETAKCIRKINPKIKILIGGPYTYSFPEETKHLINAGYADLVVLGDGERTVLKVLECLENKSGLEGIEGLVYKNSKEIVKNGPPQFIKDLDSLAFPARKNYGFKKYYTPASAGAVMTTMLSSRGCPFGCKFCNVQDTYRSRSVKNIVDEMAECKKDGFKEIFFLDDTFNINVKRVVDISEEILRRNLKIRWGFKGRCDQVDKEMLAIARRAGCFRIHYGVETSSDEGLSAVSKKETMDKIWEAIKNTKRAGIRTISYFMLGCPHEKNRQDVLKTIDFARKLKTDFAVFALFSPYPDTAFYREGVEKGVIDPKPWQEFMRSPSLGYNLPTGWNEYFSKGELLEFMKIAHREFYFNPASVIRTLFKAHSLTEIKRLIIGGISIIKLEFLNSPEGKL